MKKIYFTALSLLFFLFPHSYASAMTYEECEAVQNAEARTFQCSEGEKGVFFMRGHADPDIEEILDCGYKCVPDPIAEPPSNVTLEEIDELLSQTPIDDN